MLSAEAEELKARGNEKYKVCAYKEAIESYKAAVALQPKEPIYLSNMSAAQFEDGQYIESLLWCEKALSLIEPGSTTYAALRSKLLNRRSKLHTLLHAEDPLCFVEAKNACDAVLADKPDNALPRLQKEALERRQASHNISEKVNQRLTQAPRYRHPLKPVLEYYTIGQDLSNSIFRYQYRLDDHPKNTHSFADRFHMRVPRDGSPFEFSALFCGVGDARHVFASLADIGLDLADRNASKKAKVSSNIKVHFSLIDIHATALSRDLIILTLIHELSSIPRSQQKTDPRALELLLTLHYTYWGTTMPPLAHAILVKTLTQVHLMIEEAAEKTTAVDISWLYIGPKTVRELQQKLTWWKGKGQTALSFSDILPGRIESDKVAEDELMKYALNPQDQAALKASKISRRDDPMKDPEMRKALKIQAEEMGMSLEDVVKLFKQIPGEELQQLSQTPPNAYLERQAWRYLQVMVPPSQANEPKGLDTIFKGIRSGEFEKLASPSVLKKAFERIKGRWCSNFTLYDEDWLAANWGRSIGMDFCPFKGVMCLFPKQYMGHLSPKGEKGGLYDWSATFFSLVADGMRRLRECGPEGLKLEIIQGDGFAIMDQIRMGTLTRNPALPSTFDRIHTSNVPDYIGGYLASFTTAAPLLKSHPASYYASCSLLNSGLWEGGLMSRKFDVNLDSALYTYAGVTRAETTPAYGVTLCSRPSYPGDYHMFRQQKEVSRKLGREQLATLAYACFIKTVFPVKYERPTSSTTIREVQNVHAFFRVMENFKTLGYAPHLLADIVEAILENRVNSSPRPHQVVPIPLASRKQPGVILCTTPFTAEFEVTAAMWEPRLFPICSKLVPTVDNILRYSVRFEVGLALMSHTLPKTHFVLALVFGLPRDLDAGVAHLREDVIGKRDCRTSIQLMSTFDYNHGSCVATFFLSKMRAEQFIRDGYEVGLLNTVFWRVQSNKIKCTDMEHVGGLDAWDQTHEVAKSPGRKPTERELVGWANDAMGGLFERAGMGNFL